MKNIAGAVRAFFGASYILEVPRVLRVSAAIIKSFGMWVCWDCAAFLPFCGKDCFLVAQYRVHPIFWG